MHYPHASSESQKPRRFQVEKALCGGRSLCLPVPLTIMGKLRLRWGSSNPPSQTPLQACLREGPERLCAEGSVDLAVAGGLARPGFLPWIHCTVSA